MPSGFFWKNDLNSLESVRRVTPYLFAITFLLSTPVSQATRRSCSWRSLVSGRCSVFDVMQTGQKYRTLPAFVFPYRCIRRPHTAHFLLFFLMQTDNRLSV